VVIGPGADASSPGKFDGPDDDSRAPALVYPLNRTLVPANLQRMEFQFRPGDGNTLFRLWYRGEDFDLQVYVGCDEVADGCVYEASETVWELISEHERGQPPGRWIVSGVDGDDPGGVGTSETFELGIGEQDVTGGIYYWNAGAGRIMRYDFGRADAQAELYIDPVRGQAQECVGCHALSADGAKLAFGVDEPNGVYRVFDVAARSALFSSGAIDAGREFFAFSPDGGQMLAANGSSIAWQDAVTGTMLDPTLAAGTMPDWSPTGDRIAFATSCGAPCNLEVGVENASLQTMSFDGATWGAPSTLVSGGNNYYPAFSPDGEYVLYNHAATGYSYENPAAEVWVVPAAGGEPRELERASTSGASWPKWTPGVHTYQGHPLMWFTFSSRRRIGLRPSPLDTDDRPVAQIWMAAFDPTRLADGEDPSAAAFWLPFQEPDSGNHIAQWTTEVVPVVVE
jgi:hypothetical protein